MPMTKSELMYLSLGLAVGGTVGANWSKIKPLLEEVLGPAKEGFGDAYGDLMEKVVAQAEAFQDNAAERRHEEHGAGKKRKKKKSKKHVAPVGGNNGAFATN